jgi:hypothetical protein
MAANWGYMRKLRWIALSSALVLFACASPYQDAPTIITPFQTDGGWIAEQEKDRFGNLIEGLWSVGFDGTTNTTVETAQTYVLYRCATLVLEHAYDGFEIVSQNREFVAVSNPLLRQAQIIILPVPLGTPRSTAYRMFALRIKMLKQPFQPTPPKIFDATALKRALEPHVTGKKCEGGNVCPFDHTYLIAGT